MSIAPYEQAVASTRAVLAAVKSEHLGADTPCAKWKVSDLINHIVGGQYFFASATQGSAPSGGEQDFSSGDFVAAFDEGSRQAVAAFSADGALERIIKLPFGDMPGAAWMGIAATDTFTHGWDLARATGQATDLAPDLAAGLLAASRQMISDAFRSEEGNVFGPAKDAPAGASNADQLAAFLGRSV